MKTILSCFMLCALAVVGAHFRQAPSTTQPVPFDLDLVNLQIAHAAKDSDILLLGDSLTERWRFRPEILDRTFPKQKVANLGVGGMRAGNLLWLVQSKKLLAFNPKIIIVMIGTNDIQAGPPAFLERRHAAPADVVLGTEKIVRALRDEFPGGTQSISINPPQIRFADFDCQHCTDAVHWRADYMSEDGLHLSDAGYEYLSLEFRRLLGACDLENPTR